MQERTRDSLETLALLPESTCDDRQAVRILAVRPATVALKEEATRLSLTTCKQHTAGIFLGIIRHGPMSLEVDGPFV